MGLPPLPPILVNHSCVFVIQTPGERSLDVASVRPVASRRVIVALRVDRAVRLRQLSRTVFRVVVARFGDWTRVPYWVYVKRRVLVILSAERKTINEKRATEGTKIRT